MTGRLDKIRSKVTFSSARDSASVHGCFDAEDSQKDQNNDIDGLGCTYYFAIGTVNLNMV